MRKRYSIAEARDKLGEIIRGVEQGTTIELTRRGEPVAMIVSIQHYQQLQTGRIGFWSAYETFRGKFDLEQLDIQPEIFSDLPAENSGS